MTNWLTKKPVLCHCVYFVYAGALMLCAGAFLALLTLFFTPNFINFFVLILLLCMQKDSGTDRGQVSSAVN